MFIGISLGFVICWSLSEMYIDFKLVVLRWDFEIDILIGISDDFDVYDFWIILREIIKLLF